MAGMRRVTWLFLPCAMACSSAEPPADPVDAAKEAAPKPEPEPAPAIDCLPGATRPCYPGPPGTHGVGACKSGVETCNGAGFGACEGAVVPAAAEDCRTPEDDNCDGRSDDCPEAAVALAVALTGARPLSLAHWGGGLGIIGGPLFWVVEPGGRVVDLWSGSEAGPEPGWERQPGSGEAQTVETGGAWPGALLRSYETGSTPTGYVLAQEIFDGAEFSRIQNASESLQWRYEQAAPWRGHAIALQRTIASFEAMEKLDASTLEQGGITDDEQRKLQRKVDGLLTKAKPRLVLVPAGEVARWERSFELFATEDEGELEDDAAGPDGVAELTQPPELPDELQSFAVLSDGTIATLGGQSRIWTWKPGQRRWNLVAPPEGFSLGGRDASLHAGPGGEMILRDCDGKQASGTLWRFRGTGWEQLWLPTTACPRAIATAPDLTRYMVVGEQLWLRPHDKSEPWQRVTLPEPWKPRQVVWFHGNVWVAAEGEGGKWAVLVDRPVNGGRELVGE
jgi:hypothetical protein